MIPNNKECLICKKTFTVTHKRRVYCGLNCGYIAQLEKVRIRLRSKKNNDKSERKCFVCKKLFTATVGHQIYCGDFCQEQQRKRQNPTTKKILKAKEIIVNPPRKIRVKPKPEHPDMADVRAIIEKTRKEQKDKDNKLMAECAPPLKLKRR